MFLSRCIVPPVLKCSLMSNSLLLAGYVPSQTMPPMLAPPGAPSIPGQVNAPLRPPTINVPSTIPGNTTTPTSSKGPPSLPTPVMYQANPVPPSSGSYDSFNPNTQAPPESNQ